MYVPKQDHKISEQKLVHSLTAYGSCIFHHICKDVQSNIYIYIYISRVNLKEGS